MVKNGKKWLKHRSSKRKLKCPYCDATGTRGACHSTQIDIKADVHDQWPDGDIFYEEKAGKSNGKD